MLNEPRRISRKNKTKTSASKRLGSLSCVFAIRNAAPFHFLSRSRRRAAGTDCSLAVPFWRCATPGNDSAGGANAVIKNFQRLSAGAAVARFGRSLKRYRHQNLELKKQQSGAAAARSSRFHSRAVSPVLFLSAPTLGLAASKASGVIYVSRAVNDALAR